MKERRNPNSNQKEKKTLLNNLEINIKIRQLTDYRKLKRVMSSKDFDKKIELLELEVKLGKKRLEDVQQELNRLKLLAMEEDIREQDSRQLLNG